MLALVTGASSGIGLQYATQLARDYQCDLLLVSNQEAELQQVAEDLKKQYGVRTIARYADLSKQDAAEVLHAWCHEQGFVVDILVNNAADGDMEGIDTIEKITQSVIDETFA